MVSQLFRPCSLSARDRWGNVQVSQVGEEKWSDYPVWRKQTGKSLGMLTLDDSLAALVSERVIDLEQARRFAVDRSRFAG